MVSHALDEWEVDRKAEIRLARELAVKSPPELPAQSAANILLASYIRVCVAEFQAFCAALYGEAVESVRTVLDRAVSPALRDQLVNRSTRRPRSPVATRRTTTSAATSTDSVLTFASADSSPSGRRPMPTWPCWTTT